MLGSTVAIAGRSIPGSVFRTKREIAISAPVLPALTQALRYKKDSSMRVAIDLVKSGEAHADQHHVNLGHARLELERSRDRHMGAVVAAHAIDRDGDQRATLLWT